MMESSKRAAVADRNNQFETSDNWLLRTANACLQPAGLMLVAKWRLNGTKIPTFCYRGQSFDCFFHPYNCGRPPWRMTERAMELAIAERWLSAVGVSRVIEIGAVTPYYWPHRIKNIVDPYDGHPLVTNPQSLFAIDLTGLDVLSISTLEHIGLGDYGAAKMGETAIGALNKVCHEASNLLLTLPYGFNPTIDEFVFSRTPFSERVTVTYMIRSQSGNDWREVPVEESAIPYSAAPALESRWANSVAIIERARDCG